MSWEHLEISFGKTYAVFSIDADTKVALLDKDYDNTTTNYYSIIDLILNPESIKNKIASEFASRENGYMRRINKLERENEILENTNNKLVKKISQLVLEVESKEDKR